MRSQCLKPTYLLAASLQILAFPEIDPGAAACQVWDLRLTADNALSQSQTFATLLTPTLRFLQRSHCFPETWNRNLLLMMLSFCELFTMAMYMRLSILPNPVSRWRGTAYSLPLMVLFGLCFPLLHTTNCVPSLSCVVRSPLPNIPRFIIKLQCRFWGFLVLFASKSFWALKECPRY